MTKEEAAVRLEDEIRCYVNPAESPLCRAYRVAIAALRFPAPGAVTMREALVRAARDVVATADYDPDIDGDGGEGCTVEAIALRELEAVLMAIQNAKAPSADNVGTDEARNQKREDT